MAIDYKLWHSTDGMKARTGFWIQNEACPHCNVLNFPEFTAEYYHLMPEKLLKYKCRNCKREVVVPIRPGDYT